MSRFWMVFAVLLLIVSSPARSSAGQFAPVPTLAILYFDNATGADHLGWLPKGFLDLLIRDFQQVPSFKVVPRGKIEEAVKLYPTKGDKKYVLQRNTRIGKILDATHVVTGRFTRVDTNLVIEIKVYDVKTGTLRGWRQVDGPSDDLIYLQKQTALRILELMDARLPDREMIALVQLPTTDVKAFAYYAMGLDAVDRGDRDLARQHFQTSLAADKYFRPAVDAISRLAFVLSGKAVIRAAVEETRAIGASGLQSVQDLIDLARANAFDFSVGEPRVAALDDDSTRVNVNVPFQASIRQDYVNLWLYAIRRLAAAAPDENAGKTGASGQFVLTRSDMFDQPLALTIPSAVASDWLNAWRRLTMRLVFQNSSGAVLFESPGLKVLPLYVANTEGQFEPGFVTFWKIDTAFDIERVPKQFFDEPLQVSLEIDR